MKTYTFFFVLFFSTILWGQKTIHFNHLDSKWNVANTFPAANQQNPNFAATKTTIYGYLGDTLINKEQWFKLYSTNDSLFQKDLVCRGLTRSENNRVLYLDTANQLDTLYDFNLNLGDSVLFNLYGKYPEKIPITSIDSIQLKGEFYKRFKFAEPRMIGFNELNEVWIEGIGSIHGPIFPAFPIKFSQEIPDSMLLTCTYSNKQQVWKHPSYSNCYINIVLGIETQRVLNFKIYPNPVSGNLFIQPNSNIDEGFTLEMYSVKGELVKTECLEAYSSLHRIDVSSIRNGIYILRLISDSGKYDEKVIVKE